MQLFGRSSTIILYRPSQFIPFQCDDTTTQGELIKLPRQIMFSMHTLINDGSGIHLVSKGTKEYFMHTCLTLKLEVHTDSCGSSAARHGPRKLFWSLFILCNRIFILRLRKIKDSSICSLSSEVTNKGHASQPVDREAPNIVAPFSQVLGDHSCMTELICISACLISTLRPQAHS